MSSGTLVFTSSSPDETRHLGKLLGEACTGNEVLLMVGPLGAGKTCFTQGLAWGLGVQEYAHSPTFIMANQYQGRLTLYHLDLYRVGGVNEAMELGLEEYAHLGGVCTIEWADKAGEVFDGTGLMIMMEHVDQETRTLSFYPRDEQHRSLIHNFDGTILQQGS